MTREVLAAPVDYTPDGRVLAPAENANKEQDYRNSKVGSGLDQLTELHGVA